MTVTVTLELTDEEARAVRACYSNRRPPAASNALAGTKTKLYAAVVAATFDVRAAKPGDYVRISNSGGHTPAYQERCLVLLPVHTTKTGQKVLVVEDGDGDISSYQIDKDYFTFRSAQ